MKSSSFCLILMLVMFPHVAHTVPDEFCLDHFDDGDCGEPATSVFYYYKPGSRCEIRTWRGCPTLNKFPDYFSCLHFCVARIWGEPLEIPVANASVEAAEKAKAAKITEIFEAQYAWKEEIKQLPIDEIHLIEQLLDEVVLDIEHHHNKLSEKHETEEDSDVSVHSDEHSTTIVYPTMDSDFEFQQQEVQVP